jgi:hypothetical protein
MAKVVQAAAMGEAVDDQRAIVCAHQLGLAATVVDAFQGVGQRLADELVGVGENGGNLHEFEVVEVQLDIGEQDASMSCSHLPSS